MKQSTFDLLNSPVSSEVVSEMSADYLAQLEDEVNTKTDDLDDAEKNLDDLDDLQEETEAALKVIRQYGLTQPIAILLDTKGLLKIGETVPSIESLKVSFTNTSGIRSIEELENAPDEATDPEPGELTKTFDESTEAAYEGLKSFANNVWEAIKKWWTKFITMLTDLYDKIASLFVDYQKVVADLQSKVKIIDINKISKDKLNSSFRGNISYFKRKNGTENNLFDVFANNGILSVPPLSAAVFAIKPEEAITSENLNEKLAFLAEIANNCANKLNLYSIENISVSLNGNKIEISYDEAKYVVESIEGTLSNVNLTEFVSRITNGLNSASKQLKNSASLKNIVKSMTTTAKKSLQVVEKNEKANKTSNSPEVIYAKAVRDVTRFYNVLCKAYARQTMVNTRAAIILAKHLIKAAN